MNRDAIVADLLALSERMMGEGQTLVQRILPPPPGIFTQWKHYPEGDAIDPDSKARWYYHAHPPEQRGEGEHGHFHIFLPLAHFEGEAPVAEPKPKKNKKPAKVTHVCALSFNTDGLPTEWFATNQWVTEEYLYPAESIIESLDHLQMDGAGESKGIPDVGRWLTLAMAACREDIERILRERDKALEKTHPRDLDAEILARTPFTI